MLRKILSDKDTLSFLLGIPKDQKTYCRHAIINIFSRTPFDHRNVISRYELFRLYTEATQNRILKTFLLTGW